MTCFLFDRVENTVTSIFSFSHSVFQSLHRNKTNIKLTSKTANPKKIVPA